MILRSWDSPELADRGASSKATASSTVLVKESQSGSLYQIQRGKELGVAKAEDHVR